MKDFLFFNHSWVANSSYIFKSFEQCGYTCDYVTEKNINEFELKSKYRIVIVYLHSHPWVNIVNQLLNHKLLQDSFVVQHDDTDFEHVQRYYSREPDLIMQRELTSDTINCYNSHVYPHHFPVASIYDEDLQKQDKEFDVMFMGTPSNPRRESFIRKIIELSENKLSHLKWFIRYQPSRTPEDFIYVANKSKIGLNYPGNSWDSLRIWELASSKICTIQPKLKMNSVKKSHMPYDEYVVFDMNLSDLEETIVDQLDNEKYKIMAEKSFTAFNERHSAEKCFEKYHEIVSKHAPITTKKVIPYSPNCIFGEWRKSLINL
tara:strand:- start:196 stop:1149 length:954 start_codon:yes stop_codon:yes gene_type:complete